MAPKVIYLKEAKEILSSIRGSMGATLPVVKEVKSSIDGNLFLITYENGVKVEIDRSNIVIITKE